VVNFTVSHIASAAFHFSVSSFAFSPTARAFNGTLQALLFAATLHYAAIIRRLEVGRPPSAIGARSGLSGAGAYDLDGKVSVVPSNNICGYQSMFPWPWMFQASPLPEEEGSREYSYQKRTLPLQDEQKFRVDECELTLIDG
jgi:hypothetical protein